VPLTTGKVSEYFVPDRRCCPTHNEQLVQQPISRMTDPPEGQDPMLTRTEIAITLTIAHRSELEQRLDIAVTGLMGPAKELQQGVLVTRLSPELFDVRLSEQVPYGTTVEKVV
jgi:hypothetical protein